MTNYIPTNLTPDLTVTRKPYYCEKAVENALGLNGLFPTAISAWNDTQYYRHYENCPDGWHIDYFDWTGTVDGVTKNWGHTGLHKKGAYWDSNGESRPDLHFLGWKAGMANKRLITILKDGWRLMTNPRKGAVITDGTRCADFNYNVKFVYVDGKDWM